MHTIIVTTNEDGQRLDRFLKKYLRAAPLSLIYRLIRRDVKVNGARAGVSEVLHEGDELRLFLDDGRLDELIGKKGTGARPAAKRRFGIVYEDGNILVAGKPFGLLTHGDQREKKDTLVNQVIAHLLAQGEYDPAAERMFTPSPVNRLDRNTSGLVVFGKNAKAVRDFSKMVAEPDCVEKYYLALVAGAVEGRLHLTGRIEKNESANRVTVLPEDDAAGKSAETVVTPIERLGAYTLTEVLLVTGRTHQIRAHLADAGHPVAGDAKYGDPRRNAQLAKRFGLAAQFLHSHRMQVLRGRNTLEYLGGQSFSCPLPQRLAEICDALRKV
jgi:23S rRNA pseudouridine955/2504/2580 synthase